MSRPQKGQEKNRSKRVAFLVTARIRTALELEAEKQNASMGDIANKALAEYLRVPADA